MGLPTPPPPAAGPKRHGGPAPASPTAISGMLGTGRDDMYSRLVQGIRDYAIFLLTPDGRIASWNTGAEQIKGYRPDEVIGRHFSLFYTAEALADGWPDEELRRAAADGRLEDEGWRLRKDGSRFWANVVITALRAEDGELLGYSKVTRDLSDKRLQEEQLRESERNLRLLVTSVIDYAIYSMDPTGIVTGWNLGAQRIKGYRADEAIGKHFSMFYLPEDVARGLPAASLQRAADAAHCESEGWRIRKDGTRLWARVTITALRDEDGTLLGFSKVTRDMTERRRHEEALREREENLRLLVEGVKDHAMFLLDATGQIRTWNGGAAKLLGFSASQAIGMDSERLRTDEDRLARRPAAELATAQAGGFLQIEGWRLRADGSRFWADIATTHLADDHGGTRGFVQIVRDLTERQRVESLESEGRRIAEFIAMLSHELRNPLAPLRNATALLRRYADKPEMTRNLDMVGRQVEQLTRLVDDLLDVSRITSGKIRLEPDTLLLAPLVRQSVDSVRGGIEARGHTLSTRLDDDTLVVQGDSTRLTQVIVNLLNNAAKYTPDGGRIAVTLERAGEFAAIQMVDSGIGMTPSLLQRAFDPFVQGVRALDRSDGGLGIGLTLVRNIVELHGGSVTAASPGPGQGSTITLTLPISRQVVADAPAETARLAADPRKVLVVDDNADAAESLAMLLRLEGHEVQTAADGPSALAQAAATRPDTVLLDIGLPGMDGYEVARRLRGLPGLGTVRLIALTGYGQDTDRQAAAAAGFERHITKPVDPVTLASLIA